jgi:hypothetical protein
MSGFSFRQISIAAMVLEQFALPVHQKPGPAWPFAAIGIPSSKSSVWRPFLIPGTRPVQTLQFFTLAKNAGNTAHLSCPHRRRHRLAGQASKKEGLAHE